MFKRKTIVTAIAPIRRSSVFRAGRDFLGMALGLVFFGFGSIMSTHLLVCVFLGVFKESTCGEFWGSPPSLISLLFGSVMILLIGYVLVIIRFHF